MSRAVSNSKVEAKCSNCGKINKYDLRYWRGREDTKCRFCGHTLSVCGGFVDTLIREEKC